MSNSKKVVVIGGNAAGLSAASQIKRTNPSWQAIVLEKGREVSYGSCGTPYYIQGKVKNYEDLFTLSQEEITEKRNIDLRLNHEVTSVDPQNNTVTVYDSKNYYEETYEYLVIAAGVKASTLPVKVHEGERIFTLRHVSDGKEIKDFLASKKPESAAVIGGGYIAMEMAEVLKSLGINTALIHRRDQLSKAFEPSISSDILDYFEEKGVNLQLNTEVKEVYQDGEKVIVATKKGEKLKYDMVIPALGAKGNTDFIKDTGIEMGINDTIKVNNYLQTNIPNIYAAGDITEAKNIVSGRPTFTPLALKANKEGSIAGVNISREKNMEEFPGVLNTSIVKLFEKGVATTGLTEEEATSAGFNAKSFSIQSHARAGYYPGSGNIKIQVTIDTSSGRVLGAQLLGPMEDVKRVDVYAAIIYGKQTIEDVYNLDLAYAPPFAPIYDPVVLSGRVGRKFVK